MPTPTVAKRSWKTISFKPGNTKKIKIGSEVVEVLANGKMNLFIVTKRYKNGRYRIDPSPRAMPPPNPNAQFPAITIDDSVQIACEVLDTVYGLTHI